MNKEFKISVLKALKKGLLSKAEAKSLIDSKGIIRLDLSPGGKTDPICPIIERLPDLKPYFKNIVSLGNGIRETI